MLRFKSGLMLQLQVSCSATMGCILHPDFELKSNAPCYAFHFIHER